MAPNDVGLQREARGRGRACGRERGRKDQVVSLKRGKEPNVDHFSLHGCSESFFTAEGLEVLCTKKCGNVIMGLEN